MYIGGAVDSVLIKEDVLIPEVIYYRTFTLELLLFARRNCSKVTLLKYNAVINNVSGYNF